MNLLKKEISNFSEEEQNFVLQDKSTVLIDHKDINKLLFTICRYTRFIKDYINKILYLFSIGADVNFQHPEFNYYTSLMISVRRSAANSTVETVKLLIDNGANVDIQNYEGWSALIIGARVCNMTCSIESINLLLEARANPNLLYKNAATALMMATSNLRDTNNPEAFEAILYYPLTIINLFSAGGETAYNKLPIKYKIKYRKFYLKSSLNEYLTEHFYTIKTLCNYI